VTLQVTEFVIGLLRATHFLGVLLLPGTLFGSVPMLIMAVRSADASVIRHSLARFHAFDRIRVPLGGLLLVLSGVLLSLYGDEPTPPQPLLVKQILLYSAGLIWRLVLYRQQKTMIRIAQTVDCPMEDPEFRRVYRNWFRWGMLALSLLLAAMISASLLARFI